MQALASLFTCGQRVAVQDVNGRDVNGAAHGAHCTFEIALSLAAMLTLMLVCAFSPRVHSIPRGPLFLKLTTKRHKVTVKTDTLHNASVCTQPPNANLMVGFLPLITSTNKKRIIIDALFVWWTLTDSFNSGTGEFTRKVERQRVAVQGDSPRKFICAEDVDGQKVTLTDSFNSGTGEFTRKVERLRSTTALSR